MAIPTNAMFATIFPNSVSDAEKLIITFSDPRSQVHLSGVNGRAYEILSNGMHFKQLFAEQHPLLAKMGLVFSQLCTYYPECCWKAACCMVVEGYRPFTKEFLQRAILSMQCEFDTEKAKITPKKQSVELELQAICGSCYQDRNSLIHQAWENRIQLEEEKKLLGSEWNRQMQKYFDLFGHTLDERFLQDRLECDIVKLTAEEKKSIATSALRYFLQTEEALEFFSKDIAEIQAHSISHLFDLSLVDTYREAAAFFSAMKKVAIQFEERSYDSLESRRLSCDKKLKKYSKELAKLPQSLDKIERYNHLRLLADLFFAHSPWGFGFSIDIFSDAHQGIVDCENHSRKFDRPCDVQSGVNLARKSGLIWEMLYHCCAEGVHEERWAENHFHEFLLEFSHILTRLVSQGQSFRKGVCGNLEVSIENFVDRYFEQIKKRLPALRAFQAQIKLQLHSPTSEGKEPDYVLSGKLASEVLSIDWDLGCLFALEDDTTETYGLHEYTLSGKILELLIQNLEVRLVQDPIASSDQ